jgi:phosphotriesterase-related protein
MAQINTTAGPVEASALGRTLGHEHLIGSSEAMRAQWPHLFDPQADVAESIEEVRRASERGVVTICDPACIDIGRNVHVNLAVTEATGVRFVMATGVYGVGFRLLSAFPGHRELLEECFVRDIEVGIQGTDVRAGMIKVACDTPGMRSAIELTHRAAARASLRTGVPIMAHSNPHAQTGLEQMRVFIEEGVAPEKVQIAHTGDTGDLDHIEALLATGCYIGMDRYGIPRTLPTAQRNATIVSLVQRGYGDRMIVGQDSCVRIDGRTKAEKWETAPDSHMTYVLDDVFPQLKDAGVSPEQLEALVGRNVHAWLSA